MTTREDLRRLGLEPGRRGPMELSPDMPVKGRPWWLAFLLRITRWPDRWCFWEDDTGI